MKAFYSDRFVLPLPEGHRFPMRKYSLLREKVLECQLIPAEALLIPEAASDEQLLRVHSQAYLERVKTGKLSEKEIRRIGFPWSLEMVERSRRSVGGTIQACRAALKDSVSANLAGGTHHAYPDHGEGFCVFNDCAVAARTLQAEGLCRRVVILDCDVHQGNGTAAVFSGDPTVFTFSIHGAKNFPFHKEPGDLDIALGDGTGDDAYLEALFLGARQAIASSKADFALYLAGADPYTGDRLGRLDLSKAGLAERDRIVFDLCRSAGLPVAVVMAGGYARPIEDTVSIHLQTIRTAVQAANGGAKARL
jgi:acetoin utilization deacetylase AcuC-like enzyme